MILTKMDFLERAHLDRQTLEVWIKEEWLIPTRAEHDLAFSEADLARAKLIRELTEDMGVNAEGVGIVLHLLDQVHGLRRAMAEVLKSIHQRSGSTRGVP
ncbi:chaperone modulator CbpM [Rhodoblastus sp.]|uniref:chaperone modulator CbpM n=1 Tax=Rhodoblastus sp. TaxID=1962975 RepID=UPI003F9A599D